MLKILNISAMILMSALLLSCSSSGVYDAPEEREQIMKADRAMSDLAAKIGFYRALSKYADKNFVKMTEGSHPITSKKAFDEAHKDRPGAKTLTWEPVEAHVSSSGDLGYTWGNWKFVLPDTVFYGNYITIWKKNEHGKWKMVYDGGNGTPPPADK